MKSRRQQVRLPWQYAGSEWFSVVFTKRSWFLLLAVAVAMAIYLVVRLVLHQNALRETRLQIRSARRALAAFERDHMRCPKRLDELLNPPRMKVPYLTQVPRDAWGEKLYIDCPAHFKDQKFDVVSAGPSGSFFVDDNVY